MTKMRTLKWLFGLGLLAFIFLSNAGNPPNARTGAPGEGLCSGCHSGGSYNGNVTISGIPSTVQANTIYNVEITISATSGSPVAGGFQLVALDGNDNNTGTLLVVNPNETGIDSGGGRTYMEQRGAKGFSGNSVTWNFDWQAPSGPNNETITFYYSGNMVNGNGNTSGDTPVNSNFSVLLSGAADPITVSIDEVTDVRCNGGNDGAITASATGGVPPLTFTWSNGMTGQTITGLSAGTYTVTVTDAAGGDPVTEEATVGQPPSLSVFEENTEPYTCLGPASVTVGASGGTPGYEFTWSTGHSGAMINLFPEDLPVSVVVTDQHGCTSELIISDLPGDTEEPVAAAAGGVLTCAQPVINLSGMGSDEGPCFEYVWSGPAGFEATELNPAVNTPGVYILMVTNICNGCTATAEALVTEDTETPTITIVPPAEVFGCGVSTVEINACLTGEADYAWTTQDGLILYGADSCILGVGLPALYRLIVTNPANGCTASLEVEVGGTTSPALQIDSIANARCFGSTNGYAALSGSGGVGPYMFLWRDSSELSLRDDLAAGTYHITITDSTGCIAVDSIVIGQPPQIQLNLEVNPESEPGGADGSASVNPALGAPPYSVEWSTGETTFSIEGLAPGSYAVTVTDSLGCAVSRPFQIAPFGCELEISGVTEGEIFCHGDLTAGIMLTVNNATGPFEVQWSTGAMTLAIDSLGAGRYTVLVTDSLGCEARDTFLISQPDALEVLLDSIQLASGPDVEDGAVYVQSSGGLPPLSFWWTDADGNLVSEEEMLLNVGPGVYSLLVTDANGCTLLTEYQVGTSNITPLWSGEVKLYPNPAPAWIHVALPQQGQYRVELLSIHGHTHTSLIRQQGILILQTDRLPGGTYFLRITDERGHSAAFPFVK